ncbi:MAG TPA: DUF4331 family protein [Thermoanaerobaculia bacterium]|nr:DUF4331 family protein [Thermoanaerobaculia bacterium]
MSGGTCAPTPSPLGLLAGDLCGYPNGRRFADDVVDITLLLVAGAAYELLDDRDTGFSFNEAQVAILRDGADSNDFPFPDSFPYLPLPSSGQDHRHGRSVLPALDVDGNGVVDALTDGLLVLRFAFGFTGGTLVAGAVDLAGCTRCTAEAIVSYLSGLVM